MRKKDKELDFIWEALNVLLKHLHSEAFNAQPAYDEINAIRLKALNKRK